MWIKLVFLFLLTPFVVSAKLNWQFQTDGMVTGKPVLHQEKIYVTGGEYLYALNKKGNMVWRHHIGANSYSQVAIDKHIIYLLADNGLHALNTKGEAIWQFQTQDKPLKVEGETWGWGKGKFIEPWAWYRSSPVVIQDKVIFSNAQGTYAVDSTNGQQLWHTQTGITHTTPAHHNNTIVAGSWDNHLYGLELESGDIKWRVEGELPAGAMGNWQGWNGFNLSPTMDNGIVYVGTRGGYVYAIEAETGLERWSAKHPTTWIGSPVRVNNGSIYYGLSDGYSVIGRNANSGIINFLFQNQFYNFAQPVIQGNKIYVGDLAGRLFEVDEKSGKGELIFSTQSSQRNLHKMIQEKGGLKVTYSVEGAYTNENMIKDIQLMHKNLGSVLSMTLDSDTLYLGSADGRVYAVSL